MGEKTTDNDLWISDLPPSRGQTLSAILVSGCALAGFAIVLPFADTPLVVLNVFFPLLDAVVLVTDLITAVLLFAQFSISRLRALLALAIGYFFTASIVIPHALTFSGAFSPTGLLGANAQTGSWLFIFWHLGFALSLLAYALLRTDTSPMRAGRMTPSSIVFAGILGVIALTCGLTWLATAGADLLPTLIQDRTRITSAVRYPISFTVLISAAAMAVLFVRRRRSQLDQWLIVVALVLIGELALSGLIATVRFSLGFYAARVFALITSSIVLIVLLVETTKLYVRVTWSNQMLRRERNNKLMNLEAMAASIAHEVRQPLTAITSFSETALAFLGRDPPDTKEAIVSIKDTIVATQRADETFRSVRTLFRRAEPKKEPVDLNKLAITTLDALKLELNKHSVRTQLRLDDKLPPVSGNAGQLQEVIMNLVQNAIEAMEPTQRERMIEIATQRDDRAIVLCVEDNGHGFADQTPGYAFDAFVTTKPNGMGLGLAICRQIVENHGGSLGASRRQPRGAVFRVTLPSADRG